MIWLLGAHPVLAFGGFLVMLVAAARLRAQRPPPGQGRRAAGHPEHAGRQRPGLLRQHRASACVTACAARTDPLRPVAQRSRSRRRVTTAARSRRHGPARRRARPMMRPRRLTRPGRRPSGRWPGRTSAAVVRQGQLPVGRRVGAGVGDGPARELTRGLRPVGDEVEQAEGLDRVVPGVGHLEVGVAVGRGGGPGPGGARPAAGTPTSQSPADDGEHQDAGPGSALDARRRRRRPGRRTRGGGRRSRAGGPRCRWSARGPARWSARRPRPGRLVGRHARCRPRRRGRPGPAWARTAPSPTPAR